MKYLLRARQHKYASAARKTAVSKPTGTLNILGTSILNKVILTVELPNVRIMPPTTEPIAPAPKSRANPPNRKTLKMLSMPVDTKNGIAFIMLLLFT